MFEKFNDKESCSTDHLGFGLMLVIAGTAFLLHKLEIINLFQLPFTWWEIAASLMGLTAIVTIVMAKSYTQLESGIMNLMIALWLYVTFGKLWGFNFTNSWPILLIGFGISQIITAIAKKSNASK